MRRGETLRPVSLTFVVLATNVLGACYFLLRLGLGNSYETMKDSMDGLVWFAQPATRSKFIRTTQSVRHFALMFSYPIWPMQPKVQRSKHIHVNDDEFQYI
ncbi:hypothetical protein BDQ17DRAFT_947324 [Cyathus striatus]|nr:hypothetical protein BDQ17DRAFT_947324 [Cyathus striatus]